MVSVVFGGKFGGLHRKIIKNIVLRMEFLDGIEDTSVALLLIVSLEIRPLWGSNGSFSPSS